MGPTPAFMKYNQLIICAPAGISLMPDVSEGRTRRAAYLNALSSVGSVADFVVFIVPLHLVSHTLIVDPVERPIVPVNEILHDTSRLKQPNQFPVRKGICQRRDTSVRIDVEEPLLLFDNISSVVSRYRSIACLAAYVPFACS